MNKKISLVIIAYNQEKFILECLESVIYQTKYPFEVVISDDSSNDNTLLIIENFKYRFKQKGITVKINCNPKNLGVTGNTNKGVSLTTGDIIIFAAGDDILLPDRIVEVDHYFHENIGVKGLFTNLIIINEQSFGDSVFFNKPPKIARNKTDILKGRDPWCIGASMAVHSDVFKKYGHMTMVHPSSDGVMAFRAIQEGGFAYIDKPTIKYRIHNNNLSQNLTAEEKIEWIKIRYKYYLEIYKNAYHKNNILIALIMLVKTSVYLLISKLLSIKIFAAIAISLNKIKKDFK